MNMKKNIKHFKLKKINLLNNVSVLLEKDLKNAKKIIIFAQANIKIKMNFKIRNIKLKFIKKLHF
jgi:hypothetical protein